MLKNFIVVGFFFGDSDTEAQAAFHSVANQLRNDVAFAVVLSPSLAKKEGASVPSVVAYKKFDEEKTKHTDELSETDILKFVRSESFPLFGEIGPENYQKYLDRGFPLVWAFLDFESEETPPIESALSKIAKEYRQLSFAKLDGQKWGSHAKNFGLSGDPPGIVIEDRLKHKNYVFPQDKEYTLAALTKYIKAFVDGTLPPTVKSEDVPEKNDEPVKIIVGKTFDEIVLDPTKDVLVEFYAPWCGHCKNLAPKYDELGKEFEHIESVVIAKVDSTENDTPADIKGFPTLLFYPANDKENPITYQGERSKQALSDFVRENAFTLKKQRKTHEEL